ncbi:MAG: dihydrodipicolinate synthase family protein [Actinomycetota bacterium]|nr:dihydrodipicolinate synthase family protein [Actinomycetota bacterium]
MVARLDPEAHALLHDGLVIPAHPLALDEQGVFEQRRQDALTRYYLDAGAGGLAVGVHTTQYAVHDESVGLYEPVLRCAAETTRSWTDRRVLLVAGIVGPTEQAVSEAEVARSLGYDLGLLGITGASDATEDQLVERARAVGEVLPVFGFYLQPAVGGRRHSQGFWRRLADLEAVAAMKIAPFDRYGTLDVVRAVCASPRRDEIALYTGNDDSIVPDLVTPFRVYAGERVTGKSMVGGLLGQWAVGTQAAVRLLHEAHAARRDGTVSTELLARGSAWTDLNAAVFDVTHGFAGCVAGVNEVLRRLGLLSSHRCLDPHDVLSPGQQAAISEVMEAYPDLVDATFVQERLPRWLAP